MSTLNKPLQVAVVGHTNAGKTSLLRTLLELREFGEVDQRPSTTRSVLAQGVWLEGEQILSFYDTPGLESGSELYTEIEGYADAHRHDGPAQIRAFLQSPSAETIYAQEAKVLRQLLQSDAAFYVIDCRDPVLPKYQDELQLLTRCGKPMLPVLNYTASTPNREQDWREALARLNLHAVVAFDTVSPPEGGEKYLLQSLATVIPAAEPVLTKLLQQRRQERERRFIGGIHSIAELLFEVASYHIRVPHELPEHELKQAAARLQQRIREREQKTVQELLGRFAFLPEDAVTAHLDIRTGTWQDDLFEPETLKAWSKDTGFGVGAGAAAGAGVDLMVGGLSLGLATALGAAAGGLYQSWRHLGEKVKQRWRGERELGVDAATLATIAGRQLFLLQQLSRRGHAATEAVEVAVDHRLSREQFSAIEKVLRPVLTETPDIDREKVIRKLEVLLQESL
ncbi:GTPase/DUF3482 domain-containing protein [Pseudidiomarina insulisalsae]|nr:GTPase/DUF3482 domain-containing protein [Pseudidiomarina insulisalsae]